MRFESSPPHDHAAERSILGASVVTREFDRVGSTATRFQPRSAPVTSIDDVEPLWTPRPDVETDGPRSVRQSAGKNTV
jgi:hypothetical protein